MAIVVTGAAGFIGFHLCRRLLQDGLEVVGIDSLNDYYNPELKKSRLAMLGQAKFSFHQIDVSSGQLSTQIPRQDIETIIHLAAYAGVRYSMTHPDLYLKNNILGQLAILEWIKGIQPTPYLIYASSSSVYGEIAPPFREDESICKPVSPYAVSKASAELLSASYHALYNISQTGLRFFTVYGPWGRPDMAYFRFARAIMREAPVTIFGDGSMRRDFTYIDDIIDGIMAVLDKQPKGHQLFNLGNDRPEQVNALIDALEVSIGKKAARQYGPVLDGELPITWADLTKSHRELGYRPKVSLKDGINRFVNWCREHNGMLE